MFYIYNYSKNLESGEEKKTNILSFQYYNTPLSDQFYVLPLLQILWLYFYTNVCVYLFNWCIHGQFIGFLLCFTEDNSSAVAAAVYLDYITYHSCTLGPVACYGQMLQEK